MQALVYITVYKEMYTDCRPLLGACVTLDSEDIQHYVYHNTSMDMVVEFHSVSQLEFN